MLYVNDSKATNVASTLVALHAFSDAAGVHLILGGQAKSQDFTALRVPVERSCRAVYLIGEDAPAIASALTDASVPVRECGDLERAVAEAGKAAASGRWSCCRRPARASTSSPTSKPAASASGSSCLDRGYKGRP